MVARRGDIWWADLPEPVGSAPGLRRPVLIVQSDRFNKSQIQTATVASITSNLRLAMAPGKVLIAPRQSGLKRESVVNVSQLFSIDVELLTERVGRLESDAMKAVDFGLRLALEL